MNVLFWNSVALEANREDHTSPPGERDQGGPTLSSRALAIIHLAMHDAYLAATGADPKTLWSGGMQGELSLGQQPNQGPMHPTVAAAVAGAAHTSLTALYPSLARSIVTAPPATAAVPRFDAELASLKITPATAGFDVGRDAARLVLRHRAGDPRAGSYEAASVCVPNQDAIEPEGRHQVDPLNAMQGVEGPNHGESRLFVSKMEHKLRAPPFTGVEYATALADVRTKGALMKADTPPAPGTPQYDSGYFWAYDGAREIGTPPRLYNQNVRQAMDQVIAKLKVKLDDVGWLRLLTLVNVAMADAGVFAWREKFFHDFWRPIVAIRAGARADANWTPLGSPRTNRVSSAEKPSFTPNFPAYPSGHATFGAAAFHVLSLFLQNTPAFAYNPDDAEDPLALTLESDELRDTALDAFTGKPRPNQPKKSFTGLRAAIEDNSFSRVHLGVHWDFDGFLVDASGPDGYRAGIGGVPLGIAIAKEIAGLTQNGQTFARSEFELGVQPRPADPRQPASGEPGAQKAAARATTRPLGRPRVLRSRSVG